MLRKIIMGIVFLCVYLIVVIMVAKLVFAWINNIMVQSIIIGIIATIFMLSYNIKILRKTK